MKFARVHKTENQYAATRKLSPFPQEVWERGLCRIGMWAVHSETLCLYGEYTSCLKNLYWRNDHGTWPTLHYFFIDNTRILFLNWKNDNSVLFPTSSWKLGHLAFKKIHVKYDNVRMPTEMQQKTLKLILFIHIHFINAISLQIHKINHQIKHFSSL